MKQERLDLTLDTANFVASAESFRVFIPQANKKNDKDGAIPVRIRRIQVACKRSGDVFKFPLTVRGGVSTFGDTRDSANKDKRRSVREMRAELARMLGEENADRLLNVAMYS